MTEEKRESSTQGETDTHFILTATTLDEAIYDKTERNVGIGTARPGEKLEVDGNIKCRAVKVTVHDTDTLPVASAERDGTIVLEETPTSGCLVYYSGGKRFRVQGTLF